MLDSIFSRLLWRGEAVVAGSMEIFEAAGVVLELVALPWHNGLLFGHTSERREKQNKSNISRRSFMFMRPTEFPDEHFLPNIEFLSKKKVVV